MPSPFPGMDPYLESPDWTSVHAALAGEIIRQLAPRLRPRYRALPQRRFVAELDDTVGITPSDLYPDGAIAPSEIAEVTAGLPLELRTVMPAPVPHVTVEIRSADGNRLVTAIEILSPTNKRGKGRLEYLEKRQNILLSDTHLLEIDLLRRGQRLPMQEELPEAPYFVFLSRAGRRPLTEVWPIALEDPLPTVPVPLASGDFDVPLDLQQALQEVYDLLGFDLAINYAQPPEIPLTAEQWQWARGILEPSGPR